MQYKLFNGKIKKVKPKPIKEMRLQKNCVRWWDLQYANISTMLFHIPNGGSRDIREAVQFKLGGVRAGVADMFLAIPNETYNGFFIEFKRKGQKQNLLQKKFEKAVTDNRYYYQVVDDVDLFIKIIQDYMKSTIFYKPIWRQNRIDLKH